MHKNEILEKIRHGLYEIDDEKKLNIYGLTADGHEDHCILEQHCFLDLDGDNYEEPYIVTILEETKDVLRIVARFDPEDVKLGRDSEVQSIHPVQYFTDFHCLPNPDGSYYSLGLGHLLYDSTSSINTTLNQLLDAGRLANTQTGIAGRGFRVKGGELPLVPGKIVKLETAIMGKLSDEIHMLEFKEPSTVLFQLLNLLIDGAKELSSINNASMGQEQVQNVATNVMSSQLEQGAKVFNSIQKRLLRGLKKNFEKLYRLNRIFLDPREYAQILGEDLQLVKDDFSEEDMDVKPIADPEMGSEAMRMQRLDVLKTMIEDPVLGKHLNSFEGTRQILEALRMPNMDHLLIPPDPNAPPPLPVLEFQQKADQASQQLQLDAHDQQLKLRDIEIRAHIAQSQITLNMAQATLAAAQAQAAAAAPDQAMLELQKDTMIEGMKMESDMTQAHMKHVAEIAQTHAKNQTDLQGKQIAADAKPKTPPTKG